MKSKILKLISLLLLVSSLSFCQTLIIHYDDTTGRPANTPQHKKRYATTLLGFVDISRGYNSECDQVKEVVIRRDFLDASIFFLINLLFTTRSIEVHCK